MAFDLVLDFTKGLLDEAGFGTLPPEALKDYEEKVVALVSQKLGMEMMKMLKEEDMDDYFALAEKGPKPQEMYEFLTGRIPDIDNKVLEVLKDFRKEFLQNIADSQNMTANK